MFDIEVDEFNKKNRAKRREGYIKLPLGLQESGCATHFQRLDCLEGFAVDLFSLHELHSSCKPFKGDWRRKVISWTISHCLPGFAKMNRFCEVCGMADMVVGESSTLYCRNCGAQSNQYVEEAFDADDAHIFNNTFVRERGTMRNAAQHQTPELPRGNSLDETPDDLQGLQDAILSQPGVFDGGTSYVKTEDLSQPMSQFGHGNNATSHMSQDELASAIRKSYVSGVQRILQMQCESLVNDFGATPLICGIAGSLWLRFVASTRVFEKVWADEAVMVAEHREGIRKGNQPPVSQVAAPSNEDAAKDKKETMRAKKRAAKRRPGPRTTGGRHLSFVWLSALKERIPLSMTLAVSYLSCYIARETILPTDIRNWALSGQLPYLAAYVEISKSAPRYFPNTIVERQIFPMKPKFMFQPLTMIGAKRLELQAGFVAERIGIQLPPVNFHKIAALFIRDMGLSVEKLLPYACRLYEWYTPVGLFLPTLPSAFPTKVYIMAILITSIKVLYNLDGHPLPKERLPSRIEEGSNGCVEATSTMMTRARRKACAKDAANTEHQMNPEKKIDGTQISVDTVGDIRMAEAEGQVLGKRKRSNSTSGQDRGGQVSSENTAFGATSRSRFLNRSTGLQEAHNELGDTKELLERLESVKTTKPKGFDEELSSYLEYCQNVIFAGDDRDAGMEPIVEIFQGIYEKHLAKVRSQPVSNSDKVASVDGGSDSKPTPRAGTSGSPGSPERAGSLQRDVSSAGSARAAWGGSMDTSKENTERNREENISPADNDDEFWAQDNDPAPGPELDGRDARTPDASSVIIDMSKAGFSCLPPVPNQIRSDEYVRYNFQDSGKCLVPIHEDYFRVLRACGKAITVHPKALHRCVQRVEKGLLRVEGAVERFLLGEKDPDVVELAKAVKRRNRSRKRSRIAETQRVKERTQHLRDLSYL